MNVLPRTLLKLLYENSFRYSKDGFTLSSGKKSDVYIDVKKTVLAPEGLDAVGRVFYENIKDDDIDGIGGLTLGADPIAYSAALISKLNGKPIHVFIVRKEEKKHGTQKLIEGSLTKGAKVIVIDDVVTTGGSTIDAIKKAEEAGFIITKVLALIDREEGGSENIKKETGLELESIFTRSDFLKLLNNPR